MIKIKNEEELNKFLSENEGKICIAKFGAFWCGPCRVLENTIKQYINEYEPTDVEFAEIDVDEADEELVENYNIKNIPVTVFFKNGLIANKVVGLTTKPDLHKIIEETRLK